MAAEMPGSRRQSLALVLPLLLLRRDFALVRVPLLVLVLVLVLALVLVLVRLLLLPLMLLVPSVQACVCPATCPRPRQPSCPDGEGLQRDWCCARAAGHTTTSARDGQDCSTLSPGPGLGRNRCPGNYVAVDVDAGRGRATMAEASGRALGSTASAWTLTAVL